MEGRGVGEVRSWRERWREGEVKGGEVVGLGGIACDRVAPGKGGCMGTRSAIMGWFELRALW